MVGNTKMKIGKKIYFFALRNLHQVKIGNKKRFARSAKRSNTVPSICFFFEEQGK
jgi:hypothetical protein